MDDLKDELFRYLSDKIQRNVEDNLLETYDLIYNYAHKYSFRESDLSELNPSTIKRLVSRYFRNIEKIFLQDLLYEVRNKFKRLTSDNASKLLGEDEMYDVTNYLLNKTIRSGLEEFDSEFLSDFRDECFYDFRPSVRENPSFEDMIRTLKRNLIDKTEELMTEYKKQIVNNIIRASEEVKEEFLKHSKNNVVEINPDEYESKAKSLLQNNLELIKNDFVIASLCNDLVTLINTKIHHNPTIDSGTQKEFEDLYDSILSLIQKENSKNKFKPVEKQEEFNKKIENPIVEEENEFIQAL